MPGLGVSGRGQKLLSLVQSLGIWRHKNAPSAESPVATNAKSPEEWFMDTCRESDQESHTDTEYSDTEDGDEFMRADHNKQSSLANNNNLSKTSKTSVKRNLLSSFPTQTTEGVSLPDKTSRCIAAPVILETPPVNPGTSSVHAERPAPAHPAPVRPLLSPQNDHENDSFVIDTEYSDTEDGDEFMRADLDKQSCHANKNNLSSTFKTSVSRNLLASFSTQTTERVSLLDKTSRCIAAPVSTETSPVHPWTSSVHLAPVCPLLPLQNNHGNGSFVIDSPNLSNLFEGTENCVTLDVPILTLAATDQNETAINTDGGAATVNNEVEQNTVSKPLARKRSRNPSQHKAALSKARLYAGEAHFNKTGQFRPAPTMRLPCACRMKCSTKISEEERFQVFKVYNSSLGSKEKQWAYIRSHSTSAAVLKTTTDKTTPQRKVSRKYFFEISCSSGPTKKIPACKVMFMNTLAIWDGVIDSAYNHINKKTKTPTPDKRGKHLSRPKKLTEEQKSTVKTHINSYPRIHSHYVRSRIKREYVETGLTAAKMYRQFKEWCVSEGINEKLHVSKSQYRNILNSEFNIGFFRPKKDRCQLCALIQTGTRQEREKFKAAWVSHLNNKKACYAEQRKARSLLTRRADIAMISFDLQKVLPCPKSETSVFFYKNKLPVYNLTVYDSRAHLGTCYLWHAGVAKRGSNEIGSCVMKALIHQAQLGKKEIFSFSDSCSGQNKNRFVYAMMLHVAATYSVKIRHCFLTPGHTYNDADSVHARIETASKNKEIFDLGEWIQLIEEAKVEQPKYNVVQMNRNDFFDLKDLVNKQNWKFNTNGREIQWNKVRIVEAGYNDIGVLAYQYAVDEAKSYLDTNQRRGHPVNLKTYQPKLAYQSNIPIKAKTINHLKSLCKSLAIPSKYHAFYDNILANVDPREDDDPIDAQVEADSIDPDELLDDDGNLDHPMPAEEESGAEEEESDDDDDN